MRRQLRAFLLSSALLIAVALPATAGVTVYNCHDHPNGEIVPPAYGLRLDYLLDNGRYTFSFDYANGGLQFGRYANAVEGFRGYLDEIRISRGVARWSSRFFPPIAAYPN